MSKSERISALDFAVNSLQKAVSVLREELRKAKASPKPEIPMDSWRALSPDMLAHNAIAPDASPPNKFAGWCN